MTPEHIIIGLVVAAAIALSILLLWRRMSGKGGCGCGITTCGAADLCRTRQPDYHSARPEAAEESEDEAT